jgi:hypothetical protein
MHALIHGLERARTHAQVRLTPQQAREFAQMDEQYAKQQAEVLVRARQRLCVCVHAHATLCSTGEPAAC